MTDGLVGPQGSAGIDFGVADAMQVYAPSAI
jgi:hypothetical protein